MPPERIPDEDLLDDIRDAADKADGPLTTMKYRRLGSFGERTVQARFGSWRDALELAGVVGSSQGYRATMDDRLDDPGWLEDMYHGEGMTLAEIAEGCGCSTATVSKRMKKYGIETRSRGRRVDERLDDLEWLRKRHHEEGDTLTEIAERCSCDIDTVIERMKEHDVEVLLPGQRGVDGEPENGDTSEAAVVDRVRIALSDAGIATSTERTINAQGWRADVFLEDGAAVGIEAKGRSARGGPSLRAGLGQAMGYISEGLTHAYVAVPADSASDAHIGLFETVDVGLIEVGEAGCKVVSGGGCPRIEEALRAADPPKPSQNLLGRADEAIEDIRETGPLHVISVDRHAATARVSTALIEHEYDLSIREAKRVKDVVMRDIRDGEIPVDMTGRLRPGAST